METTSLLLTCVLCCLFQSFLFPVKLCKIPELLLGSETGVLLPDRRAALLHVHVHVQKQIIPTQFSRIAAAAPAVNMASALGRLARLSAFTTVRRTPPSSSCGPGRAVAPCRTAVFTSSGAILPKPKKTPFGLFRIALVVVAFLYVGTEISKSFAALLEEHDIFVPEDDDDDD